MHCAHCIDAMVECCFPFLFRCFVFRVECESEVGFDHTEGLMDHRRLTQAGIYEDLFWLSRSSEAEDFQLLYILLSKSKASITFYLHIYGFKVFDSGIMHAIQMWF